MGLHHDHDHSDGSNSDEDDAAVGGAVQGHAVTGTATLEEHLLIRALEKDFATLIILQVLHRTVTLTVQPHRRRLHHDLIHRPIAHSD